MFWKWTSLVLFLIIILIGSCIAGNYIRFSRHMHHRQKPLERFASDYGLTDKQRESYGILVQKHRNVLQDNFTKLDGLQKKLDAETGKFADREKTKKISREITLIEQANRDATVDLFFDIYQILDDSQKARMKTRFRERSEKYGPRRFRPRHPGHTDKTDNTKTEKKP